MNHNKFLLEIDEDYKAVIIRKRKDFMDLVLKALTASETMEVVVPQHKKDLLTRFGTKIVTQYNPGTKVTVLQDGKVVFRV